MKRLPHPPTPPGFFVIQRMASNTKLIRATTSFHLIPPSFTYSRSITCLIWRFSSSLWPCPLEIRLNQGQNIHCAGAVLKGVKHKHHKILPASNEVDLQPNPCKEHHNKRDRQSIAHPGGEVNSKIMVQLFTNSSKHRDQHNITAIELNWFWWINNLFEAC